MKNRLAILSVLVIWALSTLACAAGQPQQKQGPSGNKMATSLAAVEKAISTETPNANANAGTSASSASNAPTQAPAAADDPIKDISAAKLKLSDFPAGYKALTESDLQEMQLSPEAMSGSITKDLKQAKVVNTSGFMNEDLKNFELHVGMVVYPLTFLEKTSFDLDMLNPDKLTKDVAGQMGSEVSLMDDAAGIGDKSVGLNFKVAKKEGDTVQFRGQMVMVRQNNAVAMVISMYLDGKQPGVSAVELARKLNDRLAGVVK